MEADYRNQFFYDLFDIIELIENTRIKRAVFGWLRFILSMFSMSIAVWGAINIVIAKDNATNSSLVWIILSQGYAAATPFLPVTKIFNELGMALQKLNELYAEMDFLWNGYNMNPHNLISTEEFIKRKSDLLRRRAKIVDNYVELRFIPDLKKFKRRSVQYATKIIENRYGGDVCEIKKEETNK